MAIVKKVQKSGTSWDEVKSEFSSDLTLPSEMSKPKVRMEDYSWLIYGEKKIGKTSMLAYAGEDAPGKKVFFMMCEPGGKALNIYQRPVRNWRDFMGYVSLIVKSKEFGTVVIDTADFAYDMCLEYVCKEKGIEHPTDEGWGKGWKAVKQAFTREIKRLLDSGKGVFFTSHSRDREVKSRLGDEYHKTEPSLSSQAKEVLEGIIDIWVYYTYEKGRRVMQIEGNDTVAAGHRLGEMGRFKYSNGEPIKQIVASSSAKETFEVLRKAFESKLEKGGSDSPTQAKQQIKKFKFKVK